MSDTHDFENDKIGHSVERFPVVTSRHDSGEGSEKDSEGTEQGGEGSEGGGNG